MLAVVLESGEPTRLYTALSLLVSSAAEGEPAWGLVSFGALPRMLDEHLERSAASLGPTLARSLGELRETAVELEHCRLWACAAAVELTGAERETVDAHLDGVLSTPQFLRETAGARLVVV